MHEVEVEESDSPYPLFALLSYAMCCGLRQSSRPRAASRSFPVSGHLIGRIVIVGCKNSISEILG